MIVKIVIGVFWVGVFEYLFKFFDLDDLFVIVVAVFKFVKKGF